MTLSRRSFVTGLGLTLAAPSIDRAAGSPPKMIAYCSLESSNYNMDYSGGTFVLEDWKANVAAWAAATGTQPDGYQCFCNTEYTNPASAAGMASAAWDYANGFAWGNANGVPLSCVLTAVELASPANGASFSANIPALQDVIAGQWDTYYQQVVQQFAGNGCKLLYVRVRWEENGNWYVGWQGRSQQYQWTTWVAAFEHVANVLHAAGQTYGITVKVILNPSAIVSSGAYALGVTPSRGTVDIAGLDPYSSYIQGDHRRSAAPAPARPRSTPPGIRRLARPRASLSRNPQVPAPTAGACSTTSNGRSRWACHLAICESGDGTGGAPYGFANDPDWPTYLASRLAIAASEGVPVEFWSIWIGQFDLLWDAPATYPAAVAQVKALGKPTL